MTTSSHPSDDPTAAFETVNGTPAVPELARQPEAITVDRPFIDRAGDALARQPRQLWLRYRRLQDHERGILAVAVALVTFLVVVALLSGTDSPSSPGAPSDRGTGQTHHGGG